MSTGHAEVPAILDGGAEGMPSNSCLGHDTMGCSASRMQLSLVADGLQGRDGADSAKSLYNDADAALTPLRRENGFGEFPNGSSYEPITTPHSKGKGEAAHPCGKTTGYPPLEDL